MEGGNYDNLFKVMNQIPNPHVKVHGRSIEGGFISKKSVHEKVEKVIHHALGQYKGSGVFGGSPTNAFGGISESFLGGLSEDVKNKEVSLKHELQVLQSISAFVDIGFEKLINSSEKSSKKVLETIRKNVLEKFTKTIDEISKLTSTKVEKSDEKIKDMVKKHASFTEILKLINENSDNGTKEKADFLAILTTMSHDLSEIGDEVKTALKEVDISEDKYKKYVSSDDLRADVIKKIIKASDSDIVEKMIKAYDVLHEKFKFRNVGGGNVLGGLSYRDENIGRLEDDDDDEHNNDSLGNELKKKQNLYKKIVKLFVQDLSTKFNGIKDCIDILSKSFNKSVEYNETIERFIDTFANIDINDDPTYYIQLIDIKHTNSATSRKALFIDNINVLVKLCDKIISEQKESKVFETIKNLLNDIIKAVDDYSDTIVNSRKSLVDTTKTKLGHGIEGGIESNDFSLNTFDVNDIVISNSLSIKDSIDKIKFYGNIAKIRSNLKYVKNDVVTYSKNYNDLLGESIGYKITQLRKKRMSVINSINNDKTGIGKYIKYANKNKTGKKIDKKMFVKIINWQYDTKENFYKTIEVVDLFLLNFTTDVVTNSTEMVTDIHDLIKTVQTATQWYSVDGSAKSLKSLLNDSDDKLIESIKIGDDFFESIDKCKKVLHSVTVLKNVISWFVFMDKIAAKKLLMSPKVIYNNLVNYLCASTYVCGFNNLYLSSKEDGLEDIDNVDPDMILHLILNTTFAVNDCSGSVIVGGAKDDDEWSLRSISDVSDVSDPSLNPKTILKNRLDTATKPLPPSTGTVKNTSSYDYLSSFFDRRVKAAPKSIKPLPSITEVKTSKPLSDYEKIAASLSLDQKVDINIKVDRYAIVLSDESTKSSRKGYFKTLFGFVRPALTDDQFNYLYNEIFINNNLIKFSEIPPPPPGSPSGSTISVGIPPPPPGSPPGSTISIGIPPPPPGSPPGSVASTRSSTRDAIAMVAAATGAPSGSLGSMPSLSSSSSLGSMPSLVSSSSLDSIPLPPSVPHPLVRKVRFDTKDATIHAPPGGILLHGFEVPKAPLSCSAKLDPKAEFKTIVSTKSEGLSDDKKSDLIEAYMNCNQFAVNLFEDDDKYFVLLLKAIAGKVLTTIGTYTLYNNKEDITTIITNPVRMIMGGAKEDIDVYTEATELYIRLPLLVEFYRELFDNGNKSYKTPSTKISADDDTETIAYIPDMSGLWSGLINVIFDKSKFISQGFYDDEIIKQIVREVNKIYKDYVSIDKTNAVNNCIMGLISEVNRRYGILKKNDIQKYYEALKNYTYDNPVVKNANIPGTNDSNNYNILNDIDETIQKTPSDKFIKNEISIENLLLKTKHDKTFTDDLPLVTELYTKINNSLGRISSSPSSNKSFKNYVKLYRTELENTTDNTKRIDIVMNAIKNLTTEKKENKNTYLLFIELVVIPLLSIKRLYNEYKYFLHTVLKTYGSITTTYPTLSVDDMKIFTDLLKDSNGTAIPLTSGDDLPSVMELIKFISTVDNDMTEIKVTNDGVLMFTWTKLEEHVNSLISNVKLALGKFMHVIDKSVLDYIYDEKNDTSVFYLEKHFLNHMIRNNFVNNDKSEITFDDFIQVSKNIIGLAKVKPIGMDLYYHVAFSKYIDQDNLNTIIPGTITSVGPAHGMKLLSVDMPFHYDAFKYYSARSWNSAALNIKTILTDSKATQHSLMELFNSSLSSYLNTFYDNSLKKYYGKLTSTFYNQYITDNVGFIDFVNASTAPPSPPHIDLANTIPQEETVISALHVEAMKTIYNRVISTSNAATASNKYHLLENLSEVAPYVVERFGDNLPRFKDIFEGIIKQALLYKQLISAGIQVSLDKDAAGKIIDPIMFGVGDDINIRTGYTVSRNIDDATPQVVSTRKPTKIDDSTLEDNLKSILNNLIDYSRAIVNDIDAVLVEVKDSSKSQFMDLRKDFIKNYKANVNEEPFTPSALLFSIISSNRLLKKTNNPGGDLNSVIIPHTKNNNNQKKLSYGIKSILDGSTKIKDIPYMKKLLSYYTSYSYDYNKIDDKTINSIFDTMSVVYNGMYKTNIKAYVNARFYNNSTPTELTSTDNDLLLSNNKIVDMVEDTGYNTGRDNYINFAFSGTIVSKPSSLDTRSESRLINIIDLNIVPINVHALLKEVPLINIYNYAYTFDNLIKSLNVGDAELIEFLKDPHSCVNYRDIDVILTSTIKGISNTELANNKFLGDVLRNKVLTIDPENKFNTKIVSNLSFITMLQRIIRLAVRDSLDLITANVKIAEGQRGLDPRIVSYD